MAELGNPSGFDWLIVLSDKAAFSRDQVEKAWSQFYRRYEDFIRAEASRRGAHFRTVSVDDVVMETVEKLMVDDRFRECRVRLSEEPSAIERAVRSLLAKAVWQVVKQTADHESAAKRDPRRTSPIEGIDIQTEEKGLPWSEDVTWARSVVANALRRMRREEPLQALAIFELYIAGIGRRTIAQLMDLDPRRVKETIRLATRRLREEIDTDLSSRGMNSRDLAPLLRGTSTRSELRLILDESRRDEAGSDERSDAGDGRDEDPLFFTIGSGKVVEERPFVLNVWAHLLGQLEWVRAELARQATEIEQSSGGGVRVASGAEIRVRLTSPDLDLIEPTSKLTWSGVPAKTTLIARAPAGIESAVCSVRMSVDGLEIGRVDLVVPVAPPDQRTMRSRPAHRRAFASYAHEDRDKVLGRIQGFHKMAPDLRVFIDSASLRSGEDWRERIVAEILDSDVLYLFWSSHARASKYVEWEWRTALDARGRSFIDPVPIEHPSTAKPPAELSDKHFYDWHLAFGQE